MSYDMDAINADCYEGTACLINKFEIKDEKTLSIVEGNITFAKAAELEKISQIDRDLLMIATIQSSQGVMDNLIKLFEQSIK